MSNPDAEKAFIVGDAEERRQLISILPQSSRSHSVPLILRALGDPDWRVRKEAVQAAQAVGPYPALLDALMEPLGVTENVGLANAAIEVLSGLGNSAVEALTARISHFNVDGKKLVAEALGRSRDSAALVGLTKLVHDADTNVQAAAVEAVSQLGRVRQSEAIQLLISCLENREPLVQLAALEGLQRLGATVPFEKIRNLTSDPIIGDAALQVLDFVEEPAGPSLLLEAFKRIRPRNAGVLSKLAEFAKSSSFARHTLRSQLGLIQPAQQALLLNLSTSAEEDVHIKSAALLVSSALGLAGAAHAATEALSAADLFESAVEALSWLGLEATDALADRARTKDPEARAQALELLSQLVDEKSQAKVLEELEFALKDEHYEVASAGLTALGRIGSAKHQVVVAEALQHEHTRAAAEVALGRLTERFPKAARELAQRTIAEMRPVQTALVILQSLSSPLYDVLDQDIEFVSELLKHPDKLIRKAALEAAAKIGSNLLTNDVAFALTDEEREVRLAAARTLGQLRAPDGSAAGVDALLSVIERSTDMELVTESISALGSTHDGVAVFTLQQLSQSNLPVVALAAVQALGQCRGPTALDALIAAVSHTEAEVAKASLFELASRHENWVIIHLACGLDHRSWDVRHLAAELLGQIGGASAVPFLEARLAVEQDAIVRQTIWKVLDQIDARAILGQERGRTP